MMSTIIVGSIAAVVGMSLLLLAAAALFWGIRHTMSVENAPVIAMEGQLAALELTVAGLPSLWEEERKRAKRAQDSARKSREDADAKLEAVLELQESAGELREGNEEGSGELGMQPLLPRLGSPPDPGIHERAAAVAHLVR